MYAVLHKHSRSHNHGVDVTHADVNVNGDTYNPRIGLCRLNEQPEDQEATERRKELEANSMLTGHA